MLRTLLLVCFFSVSAHAEMQTYIREYTYVASEADSKISSRKIAKQEVKRELLAELGTHIYSRFEMSADSTGETDAKEEIVALTAGFVKVDTLEESWNGEQYYIKARVEADPQEIHQQLEELRKDEDENEELRDQLLASHAEAEELRYRLQSLQEELESTDDLDEQERIQEEYDAEIEHLSLVGLTARAITNQIGNGFGWLKKQVSDGNSSTREFLFSLGRDDD